MAKLLCIGCFNRYSIASHNFAKMRITCHIRAKIKTTRLFKSQKRPTFNKNSYICILFRLRNESLGYLIL